MTRLDFKGEEGQVLQTFEGGLLIKEGGSERFRFGGGGLVKRSAVNISEGGGGC